MVYETRGFAPQSILKTTTVADKCSDMLYKSRCVKILNEGFYEPVAVYYAKQSPPVTLQSDPLIMAWNILRQGGLLCTLLNEYRGNTIEAKEITLMPTDGSLAAEHFSNEGARHNIKMFVEACSNELFMQSDELFDPKDLYTENMNTLNKALAFTEKFYDKLKRIKGINFIKRIKDMKALEEAVEHANAANGVEGAAGGEAAQPVEAGPVDKRLKAIEEILTSEKAYVSDLDHIFQYKNELKIAKMFDKTPELEKIFSNFEELYNFQQRYSYLVDRTINRTTLKDVHSSYEGHIFKKLFTDQEAAFEVYMTYVANLPTARVIVKENMEALMTLQHVMDPQGQLDSFLIKPTQRLCKYPLLIREVIRNSAKDAPDLDELQQAYDVADHNAARVNELLAQGENDVEAERMKGLVQDWTLNKRAINPNDLGRLIRFERCSYIKEGSTPSDITLYLFEKRILICRAGKTVLRGSQTMGLKWGQPVENVHSYEDTSRPSDPFYGFRLYYYSGNDLPLAHVDFETRSAEGVKLWIKAFKRVEIPSVEEAPPEPSPVPVPQPPSRSSIFGKRSTVAIVATPSAAIGNATRNSGRKEPSISEEAEAPSVTAPSVQPNERAATAPSNVVQLKFGYKGQFYYLLIPHIPSVDQLKRLTFKTIKADWDTRGLPLDLTKDAMVLKFRDDVGDLINVLDDNSLTMAHKYITPNRLTVHIFDSNDEEQHQ